jgi:hypothetical protein
MSDLCFTRREAWFWRVERPLEIKFAAEKATRMLLSRDAADSNSLAFNGTSSSKDPGYRARLCLESVDPERYLYSLHMEASASARWFTPEKLDQLADRAWQLWTSAWRTLPPQPLLRDEALYERAVREVLARESESANREEAEAPVAAARQVVLDGLRAGKRCAESNKEGFTSFRFEGGEFVRNHIGEWEERKVFAGADALLADLRQFYDWDTKRETYPHSPPEAEVWKYILGRLR